MIEDFKRFLDECKVTNPCILQKNSITAKTKFTEAGKIADKYTSLKKVASVYGT